jgi:hypothetical protein
MEVIAAVSAILVGLAILAAALYALAWVALILYALWPTIVGFVVGIGIWTSGSDNVGAIVIVLGIIGQFVYTTRMDSGTSGSSTPIRMRGKKKRYDSDGNVVGYEDN